MVREGAPLRNDESRYQIFCSRGYDSRDRDNPGPGSRDPGSPDHRSPSRDNPGRDRDNPGSENPGHGSTGRNIPAVQGEATGGLKNDSLYGQSLGNLGSRDRVAQVAQVAE